MKKTIALLLCAILTLSCAACAASPGPEQTTSIPTQPTTQPPVTQPPVTEPPVSEPPVVDTFEAHEKYNLADCKPLRGIWSTPITLDASLLNLQGFEEEVTFRLYYSFDKRGCFTAFLNEEHFEYALTTYESLVIEYMVDKSFHSFRGKLEYTGPTEEEILAMWKDGPESEARANCTDFVASLNLYHKCMKLTHQGQYYLEDGKLYTQLDEDTFETFAYTVSGGTLTLKSTDNPTVYFPLGMDFPLEFTKYE